MADPRIEFKNSSVPDSGGAGVLGRIVTALLSLAFIVVGVMFSLVFLAVGLFAVAVFAGWFWWKVRRAIKQARSDPRFQEFNATMARPVPPAGDVIEGEVIRGEWKERD